MNKLMALLKWVGSFSRNLKLGLLLAVLLLAVVWCMTRCTREVVTVVSGVTDNPTTNAISTIMSIIKPNSKKKPVVSNVDQQVTVDGRVVVLKRTFKVDPHFDISIYDSVVPTEEKFLLPKPGIGLSLFSYGVSKRDNILRFLRFGVGGWYNSGVDITLAPVMYNLGHKIPIITNTYFYPHIGYNINNNKLIAGFGLSLSF